MAQVTQASASFALVQEILSALPQTQCTRCGYPDCEGYSNAIATNQAPINQCPPGGHEGIVRLSKIAHKPVMPLNEKNGRESPRRVAWIDENWCIGCTRCIAACPVDAIIGSNKKMHTVIESDCTGCELCVSACPLDCIELENVTTTTGWSAWSQARADKAKSAYTAHKTRLAVLANEESRRLSLL